MPLTIFQSMRYRIRGKFNPLKQFKRNNWHRHIQFEIRRLAQSVIVGSQPTNEPRHFDNRLQRSGLTLTGMIDEPGCVSGNRSRRWRSAVPKEPT